MEDDIPLLDNTAAASLLSPTLWMSRSRPRVQRRTPATAAEPGQAAGAGNGGQGAPGPGEDHDPDEADMEQLREDMQRLADLEAVYTHLKLQNSLLERQLMGIYSAVNDVLEENRSMKRLISLLQVRRGDFVAEEQEGPGAPLGQAEGQGEEEEEGPSQGQLRQQLEQQFLEQVGRRLIANLHLPAAAAGVAVAAQAGGVQLPAEAAPAAAAGPGDAAEQQRPLQQQGQVAAAAAQQPLEAPAGEAPAPADLDALPATPSAKQPPKVPVVLEADSPRIAAYRGPCQQPPATGGMSAADLPEEAQIAAAVLATTGGDASAALAKLLDHAMAAQRRPSGV